MTCATSRKYAGTAKRTKSGRPYFSGRVNLDRASLDVPRRWRKPRRIFVNSMSDLFHPEVPDDFIRDVFGVMVECAQHDFQVLTKRPERARAMAGDLPWPRNVWIGTSVESALYTYRVRELQRIRKAAIRFISAEPLLGPVPRMPLAGIDWVIVGGESGPGARPMEAAWVRQIREQCLAKGIAFFFKQWGGVQKHRAGRELEGRDWNELPTPPEPPCGSKRAMTA